jgi:hypothetical protein
MSPNHDRLDSTLQEHSGYLRAYHGLTIGFFDPKKSVKQLVDCWLFIGRKDIFPRLLRLGFLNIGETRDLGFNC